MTDPSIQPVPDGVPDAEQAAEQFQPEGDLEEPQPVPGRDPSTPWKVATGFFAAAAIGLGIWAVSLAGQVSDLDTQVAGLTSELAVAQADSSAAQQDAKDAVAAAQTELESLTKQVEQMNSSLAAVESSAASTVSKVQKEYQALKKQMAQSQQAIADLSEAAAQEAANQASMTEEGQAKIEAALKKARASYQQTQTAMIEFMDSVNQRLDSPTPSPAES